MDSQWTGEAGQWTVALAILSRMTTTHTKSALAVLVLAIAIASASTLADAEAAMTRSGDPWFPHVGDNLTRIDWAHAVNDRAFLDAVLASDTMMIEADIVLGHVVGAEGTAPLPIMAHPPAVLSDLSLEAFLASVAEHNARTPSARKGVKLDFKSIEAFEASQKYIEPIAGDNMEYPVWLNADILPGPVDSSTTPVDADRFLRLATARSHATLSVGWTTRYGGDTGIDTGSYAPAHASAMLAALRAHHVAQPVTYPVRAGLAAASAPVLHALLADTERLGARATLTVWSSEGDAVDAAALRDLMLAVGLDRVYLDVPTELAARLHLPDQLERRRTTAPHLP